MNRSILNGNAPAPARRTDPATMAATKSRRADI